MKAHVCWVVFAVAGSLLACNESSDDASAGRAPLDGGIDSGAGEDAHVGDSGACEMQPALPYLPGEVLGDTPIDLLVCVGDLDGHPVFRSANRTGPRLCDPGGTHMTCEPPYCTTPCESDADCSGGQICLCGASAAGVFNGWSHCVSAECESSADCGGYACGYSREKCNIGPETFVCRTANDECDDDEDCGYYHLCQYSAEAGHWKCSSINDCEVSP